MAARRVLALAAGFSALVLFRRDAPAEEAVVVVEAEQELDAGARERGVRALTKGAAAMDGVSARRAERPGCADDPACLADAGRGAGARRAVGVRLLQRPRSLGVSILVVDTEDGEPIAASRDVVGGVRDLGAALRPRLEEALAAADQPLKVTVPAEVVGDGRRVVPVQVEGGPPPRPGELGREPELPLVECEETSAFAARGETPPAILAPAVRRPMELTCRASWRAALARFPLRARPPGPGLYARTPASSKAGDGAVSLEVFAIGADGGAEAPARLRAAASSGRAEVKAGGAVQVKLPESRAPRTLAIALADGERAGAAFLPVDGVTQLPVSARRGSRVTVRIAGRWRGPFPNQRGRVKVPIRVPPGVQRGVVRADTRKGTPAESIADLRVPRFPRLAAVAPADEITVGESVGVAVALARPDGRPASDQPRLVASADRGEAGAAEARGGGLWVVPYTAPRQVGEDRLTISVEGAQPPEEVELELRAVADAAAKVQLDIEGRAFSPGQVITGSGVIRDAAGNPLPALLPEATFAGEKVEIDALEEGFSFEAKVPEKLPASREIPLVFYAGDRELRVAVKTRAGAPANATVRADAHRRTAALGIDVRDRYGNLAEPDSFELRVEGARAETPSREGDRYRARLRADPGARIAAVEVRAGERTLARAPVRFGAPPGDLLLGAYAGGGWGTNLGDLAGPRAAAGLGVRRDVGPVELALLAGAEGFSFRDRGTLEDEEELVRRELTGIAVPVGVRGRLRLSRRFGASLALAGVLSRVSVSLEPDSQAATRYVDVVYGARALLGADARLGPGRLGVAAGWGVGELEGPVEGNLEGPGVFATYEWWPADLSWPHLRLGGYD